MFKHATVGRVVMVALVSMLAANVAMATPIVTTTWFSDSFDSYTNNTRLRLCDTWNATAGSFSSTGPENYVLNNGGMQYSSPEAVRLRGTSSNGTSSYALHAVTGVAGQLQILDFKIKAEDTGNPSVADHAGIFMLDASGNAIAGWVGNEARMKSKYTNPAGGEGVAFALTDTSYHDFMVAYDPVTGTTDWYADGNLLTTYVQATGRTVANVIIQDVFPTGAGTDNHLWLDDLVVGAPEPATLVLLLAAVPLLRRRR
jgi:hypothetical protein